MGARSPPATPWPASRAWARGDVASTHGIRSDRQRCRAVTETFPYATDLRLVPFWGPFGVRPGKDGVTLTDDGRFVATFGFLRSRRRSPTWPAPTSPAGTAGGRPRRARSLADDGLTFGTNADRGVCVHFHEKVPSRLRRAGTLPRSRHRRRTRRARHGAGTPDPTTRRGRRGPPHGCDPDHGAGAVPGVERVTNRTSTTSWEAGRCASRRPRQVPGAQSLLRDRAGAVRRRRARQRARAERRRSSPPSSKRRPAWPWPTVPSTRSRSRSESMSTAPARSRTSPPTSTTPTRSGSPTRSRSGTSCARSAPSRTPIATAARGCRSRTKAWPRSRTTPSTSRPAIVVVQRGCGPATNDLPGADRHRAADHLRPAVPRAGPPAAAARVRAEADRRARAVHA